MHRERSYSRWLERLRGRRGRRGRRGARWTLSASVVLTAASVVLTAASVVLTACLVRGGFFDASVPQDEAVQASAKLAERAVERALTAISGEIRADGDSPWSPPDADALDDFFDPADEDEPESPIDEGADEVDQLNPGAPQKSDSAADGSSAGTDLQKGLILWVSGPGDDEPLAASDERSDEGARRLHNEEADGDSPGDDEPLNPPVVFRTPIGDDPGDDEPLDAPGDDEPLGPGDDEPLLPECADWDGILDMTLHTNYDQSAFVLITSNGRYVTSRRFDGSSEGAGGSIVDESGVVSTPLSLDLVKLGTDLNFPDLVTPAGGVIDLTFALHANPSGELLGSIDWRGTVDGRPWLEVVPVMPSLSEESPRFRDNLDGGDTPDEFLIGPFPEDVSTDPIGARVAVHTPLWDNFYMLLGADSPAGLEPSPESPDFLTAARVLETGSLKPGEDQEIVHILDTPTSDGTVSQDGTAPYIAVWSYHHTRGWCRSTVYSLPTTP